MAGTTTTAKMGLAFSMLEAAGQAVPGIPSMKLATVCRLSLLAK